MTDEGKVWGLMNRRGFLRGASGAVAASAFPCKTQLKRPNVVFMICDDLGYGDLGAMDRSCQPKSRPHGCRGCALHKPQLGASHLLCLSRCVTDRPLRTPKPHRAHICPTLPTAWICESRRWGICLVPQAIESRPSVNGISDMLQSTFPHHEDLMPTATS
jgi:hypothetical protein